MFIKQLTRIAENSQLHGITPELKSSICYALVSGVVAKTLTVRKEASGGLYFETVVR